MLKIALGFFLALLIGAVCRYYDVPVPAPPKLLGALLIVSITVGYLGMDWMLTRHVPAPAMSASDPDGGEHYAQRTD